MHKNARLRASFFIFRGLPKLATPYAKKPGERIGKISEVEWTGKLEIKKKEEFLAVSEACMVII